MNVGIVLLKAISEMNTVVVTMAFVVTVMPDSVLVVKSSVTLEVIRKIVDWLI
jgi:hypothetical protein